MYRKQHLLCKRGEFNVVFVITKCLCLSSQTFGALNLLYPPFSLKPRFNKRQGLSKHGNLAKRPKQALKHLASFDKRAV